MLSYASRPGLCPEGLAKTALPLSSASFFCFCHSASAAEAHGDNGWAVSAWALQLLLPCLFHLNMCRTGMGSAWLLWLSSEPVIYTQQHHHSITELFCYSTVGGCGSFLSSRLLKLLVFLFHCVIMKLSVMSMFGVFLQMLALPKGVGTIKRRNLLKSCRYMPWLLVDQQWLDDVTRQGLWKIGSWNSFHCPFGMS